MELPLPPPPPPLVWDVGALTDADRMVVRRFLERRSTLPPATRRSLTLELDRRLRPKVVGLTDAVPPDLFLETIVRRHR